MRALAVAVALQLRWAASPVDIIDQCRSDLHEVEATVQAAIEKVRKAKDAVEAEQKAVADAKVQHKEASLGLAERQGALDAEQASLAKLELAVRDFGNGLESRRAALNLAMERIEEKEALRNAYEGVVAASESSLRDLEKEPLVEDTADAALVREQHLEMKRAALAEEQERLKTVNHEVAAELEALEAEVAVWTADRDRHDVFKETLEEKITSAAKLRLAVEALEKKAEALAELVGETGDKVKGVSKAMGASELTLTSALDDLIAKQGAAIDLLEESLKLCVSEGEAQVAQSSATHAALKEDLQGVGAQATAAEAALEAEKARPPTHEEAMEVVQEQVNREITESVREFVEQLETVRAGAAGDAAPAAPAPEPAPEADKPATDSDFQHKLGELAKQLPSSS